VQDPIAAILLITGVSLLVGSIVYCIYAYLTDDIDDFGDM
jgi:hypothetical protein